MKCTAWILAVGLLVVGQFVAMPRAMAEADDVAATISTRATEGPKPAPIDPVDQDELRASILRGVEFLLIDQRPSGGWGSAEDTKELNIYAPIPGAHHAFRAAVTGLAIEALVAAEPIAEDKELRKRIATAIDNGEKWLLENTEQVRRAEGDAIYNTWGHAYSISGLVALYHRAKGDDSRQRNLRDAIEMQVQKLHRYEYLKGGWGYYDFDYRTQIPADSPNSFTTATALVALKQAQEMGVDVSQATIDKAIASIKRQQQPDFSYAYGEYLMMRPMYPINRAAGSLGRSQACNYALRIFGDKRVTDEVIETWLNRLYARNGWLSIGRKRPVPHESHFAIAGYFYYYGHYYAALTLDLVPKEKRGYFQDHLAAILMPLQETDGCWWDYPFYNYHRQYGTAMAVTSLVKCLRDDS